MSYHKNKINPKWVKIVIIVTAIALTTVGIIGYLVFDSFRKSVGLIFLYLAIDFITPQPDFDKLVIVPFIYAPLIIRAGITRNYAVAYLIGAVFSFFLGLLCLLIAIILLGKGTWGKFKDGVKDSLNAFYNLLTNIYFITALAIIISLIILFAWYYPKRNNKSKRRKYRNNKNK